MAHLVQDGVTFTASFHFISDELQITRFIEVGPFTQIPDLVQAPDAEIILAVLHELEDVQTMVKQTADWRLMTLAEIEFYHLSKGTIQ